jgi:hypothetical protein
MASEAWGGQVTAPTQAVDDSILTGSLQISRLRDISLRRAIELHVEQCRENARDDDADYWSQRVERGEHLLLMHNSEALRDMAYEARGR